MEGRAAPTVAKGRELWVNKETDWSPTLGPSGLSASPIGTWGIILESQALHKVLFGNHIYEKSDMKNIAEGSHKHQSCTLENFNSLTK